MEQNLIGLLISVIIGGFIGWITNLIAVKALFHPQKSFKVFGYDWQGLLPKRKKELANNLGNMVEGELVNIPELVKKVKPEDVEPLIDKLVEEHKQDIETVVRGYIENMLKKIPFLGGVGINTFVGKITYTVAQELKEKTKQAMPKVLTKVGSEIVKHISVHDIVQQKVNDMDLDKLEAMVNRIADKEMKMIEYLGGVLGAIVGAIQWVLQHYVLA